MKTYLFWTPRYYGPDSRMRTQWKHYFFFYKVKVWRLPGLSTYALWTIKISGMTVLVLVDYSDLVFETLDFFTVVVTLFWESKLFLSL